MLEKKSNQIKEFAATLKAEIERLRRSHWSLGQRVYIDFWNHVKELNLLFKNSKLSYEDRNRLWSEFIEICNNVKADQERERHKKEIKSKMLRDDIMGILNSAKVQTFFGFDNPDITELKRLGALLKKGIIKLSENKLNMVAHHKNECFIEIQTVRNSHDIWWAELKKGKNQKQQDFVLRIRENIRKNNEKLNKASQVLESLERNRRKLKDEIHTAWNDDFKSRAYGWLAETEAKIEDIKSYLRRLEGWISEDESKL
jgi:hypothetical protein